MTDDAARRPLKTRSAAWAQALARWLTRAGVRPNAISFGSMVFAGGGALALWSAPTLGDPWLQTLCYGGAIAGIQLRLLCNLLDGMVAVEGGKGGPTGDLWNEVPDRIADVALLVAAGVAAAGHPYGFELGLAAAGLAMLTAYVRAMGASLDCGQAFHGPMAKPHRMALLTAACLAAAVLAHWGYDAWALWGALAGMVPLTALTVARRLRVVALQLRARVAG